MWFSFNVNVFKTVVVMRLTPLKLNYEKKMALKGRPFADIEVQFVAWHWRPLKSRLFCGKIINSKGFLLFDKGGEDGML